MNLLQFRTSLRARVGNPTTTEVSNTELDERINEAVTEIANRFRFHSARKIVNFDTTVDVPRYILPTDCPVVMKVRVVSGDNRYQIDKVDETFVSSVNESDTGRPMNYLRERDWMQLIPTPDGTYTIQLVYKSITAPLVSDSDTPVFSTTWDQGVLLLARAKHWDVRLEAAKATYAINAYNLWLQNQPNEVDEELFADDTEGVVIPQLARRGRVVNFDTQE